MNKNILTLRADRRVIERSVNLMMLDILSATECSDPDSIDQVGQITARTIAALSRKIDRDLDSAFEKAESMGIDAHKLILEKHILEKLLQVPTLEDKNLVQVALNETEEGIKMTSSGLEGINEKIRDFRVSMIESLPSDVRSSFEKDNKIILERLNK